MVGRTQRISLYFFDFMYIYNGQFNFMGRFADKKMINK